MGKKNDTTFEFQTRSMSESIDLCLMLFCYLYSRKNAFEKANSALHLKKYIEFFRTIERLDLFKNTKIAIDKKYQFMITALLNGETAENYKDESHFFHDLENEVKIHNQYSKKQIKILLSLSSFMILIGLLYIFSLIKEWVIAKSISISEIILVGIPSIFGIVIGISFMYKCVLSLKVYFRKEMNPVRRSFYHDIDIEYCFIILHSEMKRVYNEINTSHYTKDLVTHLRGMIDQYEKHQQQNYQKILKPVNRIKEKMKTIEDVSDTLSGINDEISNLEEASDLLSEIKEKLSDIEKISNTIDEMKKSMSIPPIFIEIYHKKAPLVFINGELRCAGHISNLVKWFIINGYYDWVNDTGSIELIAKYIKNSKGEPLVQETIGRLFGRYNHLNPIK